MANLQACGCQAVLRILIAAGGSSVRDRLRSVLTATSGAVVVAEADDGGRALQCIRSCRPDISVLGPGLVSMSPFDVAMCVRQAGLQTVLVLVDPNGGATPLSPQFLVLTATSAAGVLAAAALAPQATTCPTPRTDPPGLDRRDGRELEDHVLSRLSFRERLVLRGIALDKTSRDIAREMGISPKTVEVHRSNICTKLELRGWHALRRCAAQHLDSLLPAQTWTPHSLV